MKKKQLEETLNYILEHCSNLSYLHTPKEVLVSSITDRIKNDLIWTIIDDVTVNFEQKDEILDYLKTFLVNEKETI